MRKVPGVDFSSGLSDTPCRTIRHGPRSGAGRASNSQVLLYDGRRRRCRKARYGKRLFAVWLEHKARNLIAIVDRNGYQLDGKVDDVMNIEPLDQKMALVWLGGSHVDGHDISAVTELLAASKRIQSATRRAALLQDPQRQRWSGIMETEPGWHLGYLTRLRLTESRPC